MLVVVGTQITACSLKDTSFTDLALTHPISSTSRVQCELPDVWYAPGGPSVAEIGDLHKVRAATSKTPGWFAEYTVEDSIRGWVGNDGA